MQKVMIEFQPTPNPNTMKFYPVGFNVTPGKMLEFNRNSVYINSGLARSLLDLPFVEIVFYGGDFISVTKSEEIEWIKARPEILFIILQFEQKIINGTLLDEDCTDEDEDNTDKIEFEEKDSEIVELITELLNEDIRPRVAMDGGDVKLKAYKDGIAYLKLRGACATCPSATSTLYDYVRAFLVENVEELVDVERI